MEIWKTVPFATDYAASTLGRIKRITDGTGLSRAKAGRILKPAPAGYKLRYLHLAMSVGGKIKYFNVHKVVAITFLGDHSGDGSVVAHSDGNGANNRIENLRWCSQSENLRDRLGHGTHDRGERNVQSVLTEDAVRLIRSSDETERALAARFGVSATTIGRVKRGERWGHIA